MDTTLKDPSEHPGLIFYVYGKVCYGSHDELTNGWEAEVARQEEQNTCANLHERSDVKKKDKPLKNAFFL